MQSRKRIKRGRWSKANSAEALRRRRATADARREALVRDLPPACAGPDPMSHWQRITIDLYVPVKGRCDQHRVVIDGEPIGLMSATQLGVKVRDLVHKRPSTAEIAEARYWQTAGLSPLDT